MENKVEEQNFDLDNKKDTFLVKCKNCGGNMVFSPEKQMLVCPHCNSAQDFEQNHQVSELNIEEVLNYTEWKEDNSVYRCENCGAVVVLDSSDVATICPYCNTSHIVQTNELAGLKPNAVYPFTISNIQAVDGAKKWAKKRLFAPSKFKKSLTEDNVKGVYEPCYTFDSKTFSTYTGRIGKRHTRVVGSGKNRRTESYIVWRRISGTFTKNFDDVFINSSNSISQKTLDKIQPFNYDTIKVYEKKFLTGFMAKRNEKQIQVAWNEAKSVIDKKLKSAILSQYSYDVVDYLNVSTTHNEVTYKNVLLPVYYLNFKYGKKIYSVNVNGNTGKTTGKTPISILRIGLVVLISVAVCAVLSLIFSKI